MKYLAPLIVLVAVISCKPGTLFTEPQPPGKRDISNFPAKYLGSWMEEADSSVLIVQATQILEEYQEDIATPVIEILKDDDVELRNNHIWIDDMNLSFPVEIRNDSMFGRVVFYDTLVNLTGKDHLRKLGKYYFISLPSDTLWMVYKIRFRKWEAWMFAIDTEKEIEIFRTHTTVYPEAREGKEPKNHILSPTRKEFRKLLKLDTFSDTTHYRRVNSQK